MFYGLTFREGERILASVAEYAANYIAFLQVFALTRPLLNNMYVPRSIPLFHLRCGARRRSAASRSSADDDPKGFDAEQPMYASCTRR